MRPLTKGQSFIKPFEVDETTAAHIQRQGEIGPQRVAQVETVKSLFIASEPVKKNPAFFRLTPILRIQPERVLKAENSICRPLCFRQCVAKVPPQLRIVGFELNGFVENFDGFVVAPLPEQGIPETDQIGRFRVSSDRAGYPLHGIVVLRSLQRQEAHQVKGICVLGIGGESLQAVTQRFSALTSDHVPEAGLIKLSSRPG
jgi:hypothetical protein